MEDDIALKADLHPVIPQTGGWRKARWAIKGKGKSAGVRVIYFFVSEPGTVFFADIYTKNEKENLTADDKKALQKLATAIKRGIS